MRSPQQAHQNPLVNRDSADVWEPEVLRAAGYELIFAFFFDQVSTYSHTVPCTLLGGDLCLTSRLIGDWSDWQHCFYLWSRPTGTWFERPLMLRFQLMTNQVTHYVREGGPGIVAGPHRPDVLLDLTPPTLLELLAFQASPSEACS